jgi:hypothetical protein
MKLFHTQHYTNKNGQPATSTLLHVGEMPCPTEPYPAEMRRRAMRLAQPLAQAFDELGQSLQVQRDQISGTRLDARKRRAAGVALLQGEVDVNALRPYERRSLTLDMPRLVIAASCGVAEVNQDRTYVKRVTELALTLAWACESLGIGVTAALLENHLTEYLSASQPVREAHLAYVLVTPGRFTPLQRYAVTLSRENFYGVGFKGAYLKDAEFRLFNAKLQARTAVAWGGSFPGWNGGRGVAWARATQAADMVIGIGQLSDRDDADIRLENKFEPEEAVRAILEQIKRLR